MPEAKKLIIEALANVRGVADLSKAVKALTRDATDLGKVLGKINIGGTKGPTDHAAITKQFDKLLKQLRDVGVVGKDTAKILGETMGRAIDGERQKLKDLTAAIKETENQYKSAKDRYSQFAQALKTGRDHDGTVLGPSGIVKMRERRDDAADEVAGLGKRHGELIGESNRVNQNLSGTGDGWVKKLAGAIVPKLSVGLFAAQAARSFMNLPEGLNRLDQMYLSNQAGVNSIYGGMQAASRSGNLSYALAVRQILSDKDQRRSFLNVKDPSNGRYIFQAVRDAAGGVAKVSPNDILQAMTAMDPNAAREAFKMINTQVANDPLGQQALSWQAARADQDVGFFRLFGNANRAQGKMLAAGRSGFSMDLYQQITSGIIGRGGREASGLGGLATRATGSGLDGGMLATLAGVGNAGGGGRALLDHLLTASAPGGGMNLAAGNLIGRYVSDNFSGGAGYTDGSALMSALSTGTGGRLGAFNAQNNIAGLSGIQSLMSGSLDGFQRGRNLVTAMGVLGPGGSLEGAQALAGMNDMPRMMEILKGGKVSRAMAAMGIDGDTARAYISKTLDSLGSRTISENDSSDLSGLQRAVRGGVHMSDLLSGKVKKIDGVNDVDGALMAFLQSRMGMTENAAEGFLHDMRGAPLKKGGSTDGAAGSQALKLQQQGISGQVLQMKDSWIAANEALEGNKVKLQELTDTYTTHKGLMEQMNRLQEHRIALEKLALKNMRNGVIPHPKAKARH